mmetsp:Transcript_5886/g.8913  ORF Transcript_5886/g.8913 Transcript_5886/m.8913 type:complete len:91 (-) Transcript_5886:184-456(-)
MMNNCMWTFPDRGCDIVERFYDGDKGEFLIVTHTFPPMKLLVKERYFSMNSPQVREKLQTFKMVTIHHNSRVKFNQERREQEEAKKNIKG